MKKPAYAKASAGEAGHRSPKPMKKPAYAKASAGEGEQHRQSRNL